MDSKSYTEVQKFRLSKYSYQSFVPDFLELLEVGGPVGGTGGPAHLLLELEDLQKKSFISDRNWIYDLPYSIAYCTKLEIFQVKPIFLRNAMRYQLITLESVFIYFVFFLFTFRQQLVKPTITSLKLSFVCEIPSLQV